MPNLNDKLNNGGRAAETEMFSGEVETDVGQISLAACMDRSSLAACRSEEEAEVAICNQVKLSLVEILN